MTDVSPFPIPRAFKCPYCGVSAPRCKFEARTAVAFFSHNIEEKVKVGQATQVTLYTVHLFAATWDGSEWRHAPSARLRSPKVCERLGDFRGSYTDWTSCDKND
jgi:hypothetical protein